MNLNGDFVAEWLSATLASKELNVSRGGIIGCCMNKKWHNQAGGFKWIYK